MKALNFDPNNTTDLIPVDYTTRTILASAAYSGLAKPGIIVVHNTSSQLKPINMRTIIDCLNDYAEVCPPEVWTREPHCTTTASTSYYKWLKFRQDVLPATIMNAVGSLPIFGDKKLKVQAEQLMKMSKKMDDVN